LHYGEYPFLTEHDFGVLSVTDERFYGNYVVYKENDVFLCAYKYINLKVELDDLDP
jgi:hypothetical protein